jgi:flagellar biosynthesis protein FlhB
VFPAKQKKGEIHKSCDATASSTMVASLLFSHVIPWDNSSMFNAYNQHFQAFHANFFSHLSSSIFFCHSHWELEDMLAQTT